MSNTTDPTQTPRFVAPTTVFGVEVTMQYAPVRRLDDNALAGVELQPRGPRGTALSSPESLRRTAALMDQRAELDKHTQRVADSSHIRNLAAHLTVLVAIDAHSTLLDPDHLVTRRAEVVVTVDSEHVLRDPHRALSRMANARRSGHLIALSGIGRHGHPATLLSLVEPDIVITAADLLTDGCTVAVGDTAHALNAYTERTHAVIVAEGVDDPSARLTALTLGATFGIGELYPPLDEPTALLSEAVVPMPLDPVWTTPDAQEQTPYAIASSRTAPRRGTKRLLVQMSKALEKQAESTGTSMLALGTFQDARHFTPATGARWRRLADAIGFAGVYGVGLHAVLDGNIRHAPLDPDDALVDEWTVIVLGPHHAAMLSARDLHDNGPDLDRTFDFVQTYDRTTVVQATHTVLRRYID